MSARGDILDRVRRAGGDGRVAGPISRTYRLEGDRPPGDAHLVDLLIDRLLDYKALVHRVAEIDIADTVASILMLPAREASGTDGGGPSVVVPNGLPRQWLPAGIDATPDDGLSVERVEGMDGVITGAAVAIAETGTIVLDASADQGRRLITLLPDLHICVIRHEQIVATVPEALVRLTPTRPLTWISGPSATSDIELDRVEGVHGPRTLHVIICQG